MRIGLDIDNVITDFDKKMLEEFLKEDKNKRNRGIINPDGNWIKDFLDWSLDEIDDFMNQNMEEFAKALKPRKGSKEYMGKLWNDGHHLYLISHRVYPHYSHPYETTLKWLADNHIPYTKLILSSDVDKTKECRENNIDVMFDDSRTNCIKMQENNIPCYLMATDYNLRNSSGLKIVNNWEELYEEVKNMGKKKVILDTDMFNEIDD